MRAYHWNPSLQSVIILVFLSVVRFKDELVADF